ncbi:MULTISPECIES: methylmalonyl-CoA mutase [Thermoactinomyces]|jgi:methylmalonyl-CoA mutase, N-terminal domain|uniref:Methylmalonyl-CoA mutase family protein n=1 Tax=Thermoactinomyces vulgaris TaxID=2026 RepID=A0ABS0QEJ7_THEVU|nr:MULTISPECIES: methylmalonyl-CoA mutase family protein [Thermoactinomyces]KFZ39625.1 methylmalonyl-CoA mutase [Thermoactinomyces sp. Gus2-1]KYQ87771.1 methylmalonyl-CoA mutase [Thermoactinomyces sp. AS95]MBA4550347.1 methylmalonyl-CoA mutase family protein [Thermoactinomyces vulgaris]MBA4595758.1 methylmalonyl-CoA mutase family protein [Thermoactinomyces vulgaris]MBH8582229.1 methylmalonyl-CoA mutase family protein [Thermoactinomyces sp. CICC 10735]
MNKSSEQEKLKIWEEKTNRLLQKTPERKETFHTSSEIEVKRLYTEADVPENPGLPGEYPYTRGIYPSMYRSRLWTMRQYAGFGSAGETNKRFRYLLEQGQTGLSVAFDLPTQIGYDSDDAMSQGEVGKVGVAIDSLKDMERLFAGIPLDQVSTSMTINAPASVLLAMYIAVAEKQGVPSEKLRGTIQNDILKEYIARGTYIFPPKPSMRLITDVFRYCAEHVPKWNTISISGYHIREAGSTAVQEIAFTLSDGIAYVEAALEAGLEVDRFAPRLSFFFNAHNHFFEEIAKFRAARRIWAKIMKERFNASNERSLQLRFHTQTGGSTLTAQQPDNNIVRVTLQALAAVLGGTQSLHTNSRDEALALPTEESARIALRTQQIIAHESGVADTVDPLGGSYYIEALTDQIEKEAWRYIEKIDEMGGAVRAVEEGYMQQEIHRAALAIQREIESGKQVVVGVNRYRLEQETEPQLLRVDPAIAKQQVEQLRELKANRNATEVEEKLKRLKKAAQGTENLMPHILNAVKAYCTIGEICQVLREVFGEYRAG